MTGISKIIFITGRLLKKASQQYVICFLVLGAQNVTSANYLRHNVGQPPRQVFEPFEVASGDMLQISLHTNDYADGTQYAAGHQCCFAVTSTSELDTGCIGGDGQWQYTNLIPLYTWKIQVRHAADFISHLSVDEHEALIVLINRKDEMLALLSK